MDKRGRHGYITINLEVPIEVAEYLTKHGPDLIQALRTAVKRYYRNPPSDPSKEESTNVDAVKDSLDKLKSVGRHAYRLYRRRIRTDGYFYSNGEIRSRSRKLSQAQ